MLALMDSDAPPAHLLLGSDALALVREKHITALDDLVRWESVTRSTDG